MNLETPYITCIFGIPKSGKSHLIKYLVYQSKLKNQFDLYLVITGTKFNGDYQQFINPKYVHDYSEEILEKLIDKCSKWKESGDEVRVLLILDDVLGESNFNNKLWLKLYNNHRHYNLSIIIVAQYVNKIPPNFRNNAKYAFIFNQYNKSSLEAATNAYLISHYSEEEARKLFGTLERFECIFFDNTQYEKKQRFKKFKARECIPEFYITN